MYNVLTSAPISEEAKRSIKALLQEDRGSSIRTCVQGDDWLLYYTTQHQQIKRITVRTVQP